MSINFRKWYLSTSRDQDVYVTIHDGSHPVVTTEPGIQGGKFGIEVGIESLFQIVPIDHEITQTWGDGPETETLSARNVRDIAETVVGDLRREGTLKIVWVPRNKKVPF